MIQVAGLQVVVRLMIAAVLGGIIGFEREKREKAAGFRTHILVCIGSCLVMLTSMHMFDLYRNLTNLDPSRIAAQVVTGVGFLGAGTIIRYGASIKGLTTAASLWAIAAVGLAIGSGFYSAAIATALIIYFSLVILPHVEASILKKNK